MGAIGPYILTLIGMFLRQWYVNIISPEGGAVTFLTIVGVILTALGMRLTYVDHGGKYADKKEMGIRLGIHGAIWLLGLLLFGAVAWVLDKIVRVAALIVGLVIAYFLFGSFSGGGSQSSRSSDDGVYEGPGGLSSMPNIMFSDGTQWRLYERGGDYVTYRSDSGSTVTIRSASVSGGIISTDQGTFQTYGADQL